MITGSGVHDRLERAFTINGARMPPRCEVYRAISVQIRDIFAAYTSVIEPLSLDEAYLDVISTEPDAPCATRIARDIRAAIFACTGPTASAGIFYNKFLAKLASDHRKPNGQFSITPEIRPAFVEHLEVGRFHGIGPATEAKMHALGTRNGADLRRCTETSLCSILAKLDRARAHVAQR